MIAQKRRDVESEARRLARVRSSEKMFQKLDSTKLGTAELEKFFLGLGQNKKGGSSKIGQGCKKVALASILKDKKTQIP